jgi:hypothetical protein
MRMRFLSAIIFSMSILISWTAPLTHAYLAVSFILLAWTHRQTLSQQIKSKKVIAGIKNA